MQQPGNRIVVSIHEVGRRSPEITDDSQLRFAASEGRPMVTRNRDDFIRLTGEAFRTGEPHSGLFVLPPSPTHIRAASHGPSSAGGTPSPTIRLEPT